MTCSVILTTYNGGQWLALQLESILQQSRLPEEIIVSDDRSSDNSVAIALSYMSDYPECIKVSVNLRTLGVADNLSAAISNANGDLIFLADQDDQWLPGKVKLCRDYLMEHQEYDAVFVNAGFINESGKKLPGDLWNRFGFHGQFRKSLQPQTFARFLLENHNVVAGTALCFRRSAIHALLPLVHERDIWYDYYLATCFALRNKLAWLDEQLYNWRLHSGQQTDVADADPERPATNPDIAKRRMQGALQRIAFFKSRLTVDNYLLALSKIEDEVHCDIEKAAPRFGNELLQRVYRKLTSVKGSNK